MSNKKIVFCGCGPMGEGILGGLLNNNVAKAKDVTVNELLEVRRTYIAETYGVAAVLNALGQTMYVTEDMFETFTAFCCTGPIWLYKTVETLVDAGVYAGFSRMESRNMVIKNILGVAQVLDNTGAYPAKQVDDMTSPGGVTIEALQVLQQKGFAGTLMSSVDAAVKKANSIH